MLHSLQDVRNLKDPLKQFTLNWQLVFPSSSRLASIVDGRDLELRCQTFNLPEIKGDATDVTWGGFNRKYAGKQLREGDWSVSFIEVWDARITELFKVWANQYHDYKNGTISLLEEYAGDVNINLVNPDLYDPRPLGIHRYDIKLYDAFPTSVKLPSVEASKSDAVKIDCTFHYNYFLMGDEI